MHIIQYYYLDSVNESYFTDVTFSVMFCPFYNVDNIIDSIFANYLILNQFLFSSHIKCPVTTSTLGKKHSSKEKKKKTETSKQTRKLKKERN